MQSGYAFVACNPGCESWVKSEVAARAPGLKLSYSKPGFVTFKSDTALHGNASHDLVFARRQGAGLGQAKTSGELAEKLQEISSAAGAPIHLHVWQRDWVNPADRKPSYVANERVPALASELAALPIPWQTPGRRPRVGDWVANVICAADLSEAPWVGWHIHSANDSPFAGGIIEIESPPDMPSRAYRKVEEMIARFAIPMQRGERALELGSAPGGAALALLRRGLSVVGIDPAEMAPVVLEHPAFMGITDKAGGVELDHLPADVAWFLSDMHLAPQVAIHTAARFIHRFRPHLKGLIFTLKLNDLAWIAEIPEFLERIRGLGFSHVRAAHLPSHRQEIGVFARV